MTLGFVVEREGVIYAAVDSSQTSFADPSHFMQTKLLWINKNMLMLCAGELRPLKILRDLAGSYSTRLATLDSASDFIVDWLDKLSAKEDAASDCILCTFDEESKPTAYLIRRRLGERTLKEEIDISSTKSLGQLQDQDPKTLEGQIDQAMRDGHSPYQAMSDVIYRVMQSSTELAPPVVHEIIRANTIQRFA
ncbi:MAG: hypothetical protein P1V97_07310 [Planctomycetota bacterium]|nr:hypothetical protein [Planctomycetota bacterium]